MIKKLRSLRAPELRLLLAVCSFVIFFAMAQTTPTGTDGCNGHDHGKITVINNYDNDITIKFSGPNSFNFFVEMNSSVTSESTKTGTYKYTANEIQGTKSWKGDTEVKKDQTATVTIK